jgi:uncharacterized protein (TIGR01244 family)
MEVSSLSRPLFGKVRSMRLKTLVTSLMAVLVLVPLAGAAGQETFGIPNATLPEPGVMAAGQPTGEQIQILAEEGYKTVINLRPPAEPHGVNEPAAARQNGMAYVNVPVTLETLDQATVDKFLETMKKAERPVLVHCASSNRVGALYYAWLVLEKGMPAQEAMAKAQAAGLRSPELTQAIEKLVAERQPPAPK